MNYFNYFKTLELKEMMSENTAVLGPDGQLLLEISNIARRDPGIPTDVDLDESSSTCVSSEDLTCSGCKLIEDLINLRCCRNCILRNKIFG